MKILLSGGGTLGPVSPLLAIYEIYHRHNSTCKFIWVGTSTGPERDIVELYGLHFYTISSGKLRRYFSLWNLIDVFKVLIAFFQSLVLLVQEKPSLLVSAGGFVSVPLHWAAFVLGIPTWIHQQDTRVGLANKLMAGVAKKITTALNGSVKFFNKNKTEWAGNPVRDLSVKSKADSLRQLSLPDQCPIIFAFGGGTGSDKINSLIIESLQHLPSDWQIVHLTGKDRSGKHAKEIKKSFPNYHPYVFFGNEMKHAYAVADVVVGRGGFVTMSELASLSKPAILIPMSDTHQEENVKTLAKNESAIILDEKKANGLNIAYAVKELINKPDLAKHLGSNLHSVLPPAKKEKIVEIIEEMCKD
ncbi:MAG: UDP-N-acetylglucosamine--N-acetylmuramyl-(pentapeptide) pyrophosphoryl-undecaprenol N-acetylglucosamine transferase [bacterium]